MKGMLVIVSGPSGSGKGTVVKRLVGKNYALSVSVTTRLPRAGEIDGRDYFFRTPREFAYMRDHNELLEHAVYVNYFYGTPRKYVEEQISDGKAVVLEIEVNGALQIREKFPEAVLIFLMPPTMEELYHRLILRNTENMEVLEDRFKRAHEEIKLIPRYDYLVINDVVQNAVTRINKIVDAESLRPARNANIINAFKEQSKC
ncbi:MAG: guanylate kinase [Clostridiales bacterium]|jgi:guanylate kinase|nr:guanylate kinase [Clostridiales bacterium]